MTKVQPAESARPGRRKTPLQRILGCWQLYVMLLPALAYLLIFHYAPMYGVQIAFRDYVPNKGITGSDWVGLKHFAYFLQSPQFPILIRNTVLISLYALLFSFPFPILLALMLNECRAGRYKKIIQNLTYIPHFISVVVLVGMLISFTSPTMGIINRLMELAGGSPIDFMGKAEWFRPLYILSGMWQNTGWNSIIYLAALAGIDTELHEAAQLDGASRLQRIWHINLPGLMPTIVILFIMNCGSMMSVGFEKAFLMQNSLNLASSEVISTYVYKLGLLNAQFSYTAAIGLFNSLINCVLLLIVNGISRRVGETSLF